MQRAFIQVLGTGGTIAGVQGDAQPNGSHYIAGTVQAQELLRAAALPQFSLRLETTDVAQIDSKDMHFAVWQKLAHAVSDALADADCAGVLITHGSDTLEETAFFLWLLFGATTQETGKPVVLTCAMRPSGAADADGPANLAHSLQTLEQASSRSLGGVWVAQAGRVFDAPTVRKTHPTALAAFEGRAPRCLDAAETNKPSWAAKPPALSAADLNLRCSTLDPNCLLAAVLNAPSDLPFIATVHSQACYHPQQWRSAMGTFGSTYRPLGLVISATGHGTLAEPLLAEIAQLRKFETWGFGTIPFPISVASRCAQPATPQDAQLWQSLNLHATQASVLQTQIDLLLWCLDGEQKQRGL